jgi:glycosyltransferase involved in cell wall biosynthesis
MQVIVDGIVYGRQRFGGINTYFNEVLPRLARRPDTRVDLLMPRHHEGAVPGPPVRQVPRDFVPSRTDLSWRLDQRLEPVMEALKLGAFGLWMSTRRQAVFHSSYFTSLPLTARPQVAIAYDMNHELFPHLYTDAHGVWLRKLYPEYLRRATRVIAISETTKRHVEHYYGIPGDRIDVVHLAVDPARFHPAGPDVDREALARELGIDSPYVLYVGGRWHYKNFSSVLEAMDRLHRRTQLKLVVAGPPWSAAESAKLTHHPAAAAVHLVAHPDDAKLRLLYSCAAAFVFPSLHEGFGIPLLEAMACGAPVVAADTDVFHEVAGEAVVFVRPQDPDEIAGAVERLLDVRVGRDYRDRGIRQSRRYSWDATAQGTRLAYERALGMARA